MSDIRKIEGKLAAYKLKRESIDAEINRLEIALGVVRELENDAAFESEEPIRRIPVERNGHDHHVEPENIKTPLSSSAPDKEMAGMTIMEASLRILEENKGQSIHFREIARQAIARGYDSGRSKDASSIVMSFSQILRREAQKGGKVESEHGGFFRKRTQLLDAVGKDASGG